MTESRIANDLALEAVRPFLGLSVDMKRSLIARIERAMRAYAAALKENEARGG